MDEWMWRKIIEKMYDPKDFEVLESRFFQVIDEKKQFNKTTTSRMGTTVSKVPDPAMQA
jgi:DNA-binding protein YbaB